MFATTRKIIHHCATGPDNDTYHPVRIIGYGGCALALLIFFGHAIWLLSTKGVFDGMGFAEGFATLIGSVAGVGATESVKQFAGTEPREMVDVPPQ